jgi:four helix bundle protein
MKEAFKTKNQVVQLSFTLAIDVVEFCALLEEKRKWALANQIMRAGISVGANIRAQNAESKNDFIHKMKIAAKETEELEFYFEICNASKRLPDAQELLMQVQAINRILNKIIATTKNNLRNNTIS